MKIKFELPNLVKSLFKNSFINELPYSPPLFISKFFLYTELTVENFMIMFSWFMRGQNSVIVMSADESVPISIGETM